MTLSTHTSCSLFIKLLLVCVIFVICMGFLFPFSKITICFIYSLYFFVLLRFVVNENKHINGTVIPYSHIWIRCNWSSIFCVVRTSRAHIEERADATVVGRRHLMLIGCYYSCLKLCFIRLFFLLSFSLTIASVGFCRFSLNGSRSHPPSEWSLCLCVSDWMLHTKYLTLMQRTNVIYFYVKLEHELTRPQTTTLR